MRSGFVLFALALGLLAGCGQSAGKPGCSTKGSCATGSFCASTPDGNVCWPDAVAPSLSSFTVTCSTTPCRRDSVLHVAAAASDDSFGNAMGDVKVSFDADPARQFVLTHVNGDQYALDMPIADLPFPYFEHGVTATVVASDEAGNVTPPQNAGAITVTRARWMKTLQGVTPLTLSSPAVLQDGRIALTASDGKLYLVSKDGQSASSVQLTGIPSGPPAVGSDAVWVATQDGKLHKRATSNGAEIALTNCSTTQPLVGPPAVFGQRAFVGSMSSAIMAASPSGGCGKSTLSAVVTSGTVLGLSEHLFFATGASLRSFAYDLQEDSLADRWTGVAPSPAPPTLPGTVNTAAAVDAEGGLWTIGQNGAVSRTTPSASTTTVTSLSTSSAGAIILSDGSAVLSDSAKRLMRVRASGSVPWSTSDSFTGIPAAALALDGTTPTLLVPTDQGLVYAVNEADGHIQWSVTLSGQSLQPANVWTEPGASTSTAYLAGADGNLYAIIVDGALDANAPWPKAFHDQRNTSRAGEPF